MISRSRSGPTVAAMSIECTTSANSTVTCLYSADRLTCVTGAPHSLQNLEFGGSSVPHDPHGSPAAVSAPRLLSSPSVSFHCWSNTGRPPPGLRRNSKLRLVSFKDCIGPLSAHPDCCHPRQYRCTADR